ncbi:hypothetical protein [Sphingomonas sp.]|uniref:hypothetical protein n=1 Tax=Sphingomonas sp. TaxID=28214 RepID=UPI0025DDD885|nr:hypothetical protein [Sphingomonas sp.]
MASVAPEEPADDDAIDGAEYVLRRVHIDLARRGKPDRSIFKNDPGGIGTSVTLWRSEHDLEIVTAGRPNVGVVAVTVAELRSFGLGVMFTFAEGNPNHCEVFGPRSKSKLGSIRDLCKWVRYPDGFPEEAKVELFNLFPT